MLPSTDLYKQKPYVWSEYCALGEGFLEESNI